MIPGTHRYGTLESLKDRVAMAAVRVGFAAAGGGDDPEPRARPSRFWWINHVGADRVLEGF